MSPQTEIEVAVAIHVADVRPLATLHEEGKPARPLCHPVHRHTLQQAALRPLEQRAGDGMGLLEAPLFGGVEGGEAGAIDWLHSGG